MLVRGSLTGRLSYSEDCESHESSGGEAWVQGELVCSKASSLEADVFSSEQHLSACAAQSLIWVGAAPAEKQANTR